MNMSKMTFLNASPIIIEATPEVARIPVMERSKTVANIPTQPVRIRLAQLRPWVDVVPLNGVLQNRPRKILYQAI